MEYVFTPVPRERSSAGDMLPLFSRQQATWIAFSRYAVTSFVLLLPALL